LVERAEVGTRRRGWPLNRKATAMLIGAILLVGLWPLQPPEGLSERGYHALVTLIASVPLLAVEALPDGIVALLIATVWVVGGVTAPRIALRRFATTQWVLGASTLGFAVALASSGLPYRTS